MPVENISLMPSSCLSLTNTHQDTSQRVTHHGSANQEFADASVRCDEQKGVLIAGVPYPFSPIPLLFPSYPLSFSTLASQANMNYRFCRDASEILAVRDLYNWRSMNAGEIRFDLRHMHIHGELREERFGDFFSLLSLSLCCSISPMTKMCFTFFLG